MYVLQNKMQTFEHLQSSHCLHGQTHIIYTDALMLFNPLINNLFILYQISGRSYARFHFLHYVSDSKCTIKLEFTARISEINHLSLV